MNLHSDKKALQHFIKLASEHFGYDPAHVEKDYWVSKMLQEIARSEYAKGAYFKGGTSLSKAYNLIERFSEDLDLFIFTGNMDGSIQGEKTLNKRISDYITDCNENMHRKDLSKPGGRFRKLHFEYDKTFSGGGIKDDLVVELKAYDLPNKRMMYYPSDTRPIKSIITAYLEAIKREDLIKAYDMGGFEMRCVNPRKTICDKISRQVRISYNERFFVEETASHVRDIYDLTQLYQRKEYYDFLHSEDFLDAMYRVTIEDNNSYIFKSHQHLPLSEARNFKEPERVMAIPEVADAYTIDLKKMMFDQSKSLSIEKAVSTLQGIHKVLVPFEAYRIERLKKDAEAKAKAEAEAAKATVTQAAKPAPAKKQPPVPFNYKRGGGRGL